MTISKQQAIDRLREEGYHISRNRFTTRYLKTLKFKINSLIDIGVNYGTPNLYAAFPKAQMVLIDPQEIILKNLTEWQKNKYNFTFVNKALGSREGELKFYLSDIRARSSALCRLDRRRKPEKLQEALVPITTLDSLLDDNILGKGPFGIKIDTEGYEAEILRGGGKVLKYAEFVLVETSIKQRFKDGPNFSEIVAILAASGLELYDILTPLIKPPKVMDCLFVRRDSKLLLL